MAREQELVKLRPIPAEGMKMLHKREGGVSDLPVFETTSRVFLSCWAIHNEKAIDLITGAAARGVGAVLQIVIDTNVPGHPTISVSVREIDLARE